MEKRHALLQQLHTCLNETSSTITQLTSELGPNVDIEEDIQLVHKAMNSINDKIKHHQRFVSFLDKHGVQWDSSQRKLGSLCILPTDVMVQIRSYLPPEGALTSLLVCSFWSTMMKGLDIWLQLCKQHQLEDVLPHTSSILFPGMGNAPIDEDAATVLRMSNHQPQGSPNQPTNYWRWVYRCRSKTFAEGIIKNGCGTYTYPSGNKYCGDWLEDKCHGLGTYICQDQSTYEGCWRNGKMHGHGVCVFRFGTRFRGELREGKKHGFGIFRYSTGNTYIGEWEDDKISGYGTLLYSDGNKYVGHWSSGVLHGNGKFTWSDGAVFEGTWECGRRLGPGIYTITTGQRYYQEWDEPVKFRKDDRGQQTVPYTNQVLPWLTTEEKKDTNEPMETDPSEAFE